MAASAGLFDFWEPAAPPPLPSVERLQPADLPSLMGAPLQSRPAPQRHITIVRKSSPLNLASLGAESTALKKDATLREGDAVMTSNGIRIFAGSASADHRGTEFATLAETKGLSSEERTSLAEIDAHRSDDGWQSKSSGQDQLLTGRSTVSDSTHPWKWLRDPKGHLVRYVGP